MSAPFAGSRHSHSDSATPLGDQFRSPQSYHTPTSSTYLPHLNRSNSEGQYYNEVDGTRYETSDSPIHVASLILGY